MDKQHADDCWCDACLSSQKRSPWDVANDLRDAAIRATNLRDAARLLEAAMVIEGLLEGRL